LSNEEYDKIKDLLGREPNITELGIFSVMWSEHCSYKSSKVHLKKLPTDGPHVLQGPGENAGIVDIGDGLAVAFKMESHNHPSFIEPFQGAATGVGGILRDVFTMGARPIANLNSLRFGAATHPKTPYLLKGVVAGIAAYGNCMGIPTVGGETMFDSCYDGNNLVNAFTAGIVKHDKIFRGYATGVGNPVIYVGSKTGRDGIHGATMASDEFSEDSEEKRPTVQVGDPFTEKLLLEACMEAFETDVIVGIQDMGAAGLTSSSFEMASRAGTGIKMELDKVPQREEGMTPYELLLSESQERMLMVVNNGREEEIKKIFHKWELDAVVVGEVTNTGRMEIIWHGKTVVDVPIAPVAHASPMYSRPIKKPQDQENLQKLDLSEIPLPDDLNKSLKTLLSDPSLSSSEWVYTQYDHMVGTDTVVLPGSDAAVMRIKGTNKGVAMAVDCNSRYCYLDPYWGGALAVYECLKNLAVSGAKGLAITDCLNFGNPEKPEIMWQFEQAVLGMAEACRRFSTPVVSGNVSFYNETNGVPIYPTPSVGMVGLLEDVDRHCTQEFKDEGDIIIMLGENREELGGSEYLAKVHNIVKGVPPFLDFDRAKTVVAACITGIKRRLVKSAHDISNGGLAVALAESCFKGEDVLGATVEIETNFRPDVVAFAETADRILLTVSPDNLETMLTIAQSLNCPAKAIGTVGGQRLKINNIIDVDVNEIKILWKSAIPKIVEK
jgi:phosphoribosylformylglycinamidine synthase